MEKKSTTPNALLPRAANLATLGVVVAATWWSAAQRPEGQPVLADQRVVRTTGTAEAPGPRQPVALASGSSATTGTWPAQAATAIAREGLQAVGYQTRSAR
jgi:hypothetical protein